MPSTLSYPGVYIQEISSGSHTITGVSTSSTAFLGAAKRGPINKAVRVQGFADYERRFGGLDVDSDMSYAVRQYFLNGGSEAWIVRLAKLPSTASLGLNGTSTGSPVVLTLTALDQGSAANEITVEVDYDTDNPGSTFNLSLALVPADDPGNAVFETYRNLSMNSKDPRYAVTLINNSSELVAAIRPATLPSLATTPGSSTSGVYPTAGSFFASLLDATHNTFQLAVDGKPPVKIAIDLVANPVSDLATLGVAVAAAVTAAGAGVAVTTPTNQLVLKSTTPGELSSVRVLPGGTNDAASRLLLGPLFGGVEGDAAQLWRPKEMPDHAIVTGGAIAAASPDLDNIPSARKSFTIVLDGYQSDITLDPAPNLSGNLVSRLLDLAGRIESKVRASKPANPAFKFFTARSDGTSKLVLQSGTRGTGSTIEVKPASGDTLATDLKLTSAATGADVTKARPADVFLGGGAEQPLDLANAYNNFIGDRSLREGIYALEAVDLFNLMVLPHVEDSGILMDAAAYCQERRAFLIIDAPATADKPDEMERVITGPGLPKTNYAAVYYPWIKIADPLAGGQLKTVGPGGTMAGVYARTDGERGVWKAPAGTEAALRGVQGVAYALTDRENGVLNPRGANCLRLFPVFGPVSWGARTLQGDDQMASEWKYIPVRRLALFLEESLYRGTKWIVFEPNDEPLWAQIRLNLGAFMHNLFRQGAFQGMTPKDAYFVKCDKETTTQNDINLGVVNIVVGFAPLKPAEFVVIKIQQMAGQIET
jgi:phage tail sheath protein FI